MKFSFAIVPVATQNKRCQLYSIVKNDDELHEASKFLQNEENRNSEDYESLKERLTYIKDRHGARIGYFKPEGDQWDQVHALHAGSRKQGYFHFNRLRWYCIRMNEQCLILGNGGVKEEQRTQDDPHLTEKESDMRWVDQVIEAAQRNDDLTVSEDGQLEGKLEFTPEVIEEYGLQ